MLEGKSSLPRRKARAGCRLIGIVEMAVPRRAPVGERAHAELARRGLTLIVTAKLSKNYTENCWLAGFPGKAHCLPQTELEAPDFSISDGGVP